MKSFAYYSDEEIEVLKKYYATKGPYISCLLKRHTIGAIRSKANQLGLHCKTNRREEQKTFWTPDELNPRLGVQLEL